MPEELMTTKEAARYSEDYRDLGFLVALNNPLSVMGFKDLAARTYAS